MNSRTIVKFSLLMLFILFVGILSWPWKTLSGYGMDITLNILVWIWVALWGAALSILLWRKNIKGSLPLVLLLAGAILMSVPLAWTPMSSWGESLTRLGGLWAMALLMGLLLQFPLRGRERQCIYMIIIAAGIIQTGISCWQILAPENAAAWTEYSFAGQNGRPAGTFLQINLLGSFLATAFLCALWLMSSGLTPGLRKASMLCSVLLCAGVIITQSRSALLSAIAGGVLMCIFNRKKPFILAVLVVILLGSFVGEATLNQRVKLLPQTLDTAMGNLTGTNHDERPRDIDLRTAWNRQHSDAERFTLLKGGMALIYSHIFKGSGLSSFETAFPKALASEGITNPFTVTVRYPHNELIYVWCEGGILALTGILLWLSLVIAPFRAIKARNVCSRGALLLPLLLHIMTEYPLYLSAVHCVLLVILLWLALPVTIKNSEKRWQPSFPLRLGIQAASYVLCLSGTLFMVTALQSAKQLRQAEDFWLSDPSLLAVSGNDYAQADHLLFDRAASDLALFNINSDVSLLIQFQSQAGEWLKWHNDSNMMDSMRKIALYFNNSPQAQYWNYRGCLSFPQDTRFSCTTAVMQGKPQ